MTKKRVHLWIFGRVQGVYYRQTALKIAAELGTKGWVKNLLDGRVEAVIEGDVAAVDKMIEWCKKGPTSARVTLVEMIEEEYKGEFDKFSVKY
ncbi:MAG TPA: acylphosphatase [Candidatus Gastranaerophilales bacterium]|nr:acylphosphatase [Candidatus Gastranaerophilales bacterium]